MLVATLRTRPTKKSARPRPATPRLCWSCSTRQRVGYEELLKTFWEEHDPTQGMRQGNDVGTQYRSAIYTTSDVQMRIALASRDAFQRELDKSKFGQITTEIAPAGPFLLRRGLSPAVPAQGAVRLLRPGRYRSQLSSKPRRGGYRLIDSDAS